MNSNLRNYAGKLWFTSSVDHCAVKALTSRYCTRTHTHSSGTPRKTSHQTHSHLRPPSPAARPNRTPTSTQQCSPHCTPPIGHLRRRTLVPHQTQPGLKKDRRRIKFSSKTGAGAGSGFLLALGPEPVCGSTKCYRGRGSTRVWRIFLSFVFAAEFNFFICLSFREYVLSVLA